MSDEYYVEMQLNGNSIDHVLRIHIPKDEVDGIFKADHVEFNIICKSITEEKLLSNKAEARVSRS